MHARRWGWRSCRGTTSYLPSDGFIRLNVTSSIGAFVLGASDFTELPRIRSERPAFDLHYPHLMQRPRDEAHVGEHVVVVEPAEHLGVVGGDDARGSRSRRGPESERSGRAAIARSSGRPVRRVGRGALTGETQGQILLGDLTRRVRATRTRSTPRQTRACRRDRRRVPLRRTAAGSVRCGSAVRRRRAARPAAIRENADLDVVVGGGARAERELADEQRHGEPDAGEQREPEDVPPATVRRRAGRR